MISIVMSYYNRQSLLDRTIETINKSSVKDFEVIIVDDASPEQVVCEQAKIIRIKPEEKWWSNPCVPYNMAIKQAQGDIIVIQNPECLHVGDVMQYAQDNLKTNLYFSFACYAANRPQTHEMKYGRLPELENKTFCPKLRNGWYNHPVYRPVGYHFCSAILREDLERIGGGFNEEYAHGISFDDDEFVRRIKRHGMDVEIPTNPYVVHQWHKPFTYENPAVWRPLHARNKKLYHST